MFIKLSYVTDSLVSRSPRSCADENYFFSAFRLVVNKPNRRSLSLILGFGVTVAIWPREAVSCRDFILRSVATFWVMSLVGMYPCRASYMAVDRLRFSKH